MSGYVRLAPYVSTVASGTSPETDMRVAILLAAAALIAAGVGIRAATLSDAGTDSWQTAIREEVRRDARIVSDVRRLYGEDAAVAFDIAEMQIRAEEGVKEAGSSKGPAAGVLRSEAAARGELAKSLTKTSSGLIDAPEEAPNLDGGDLFARLAELRKEAGAAAQLDPEATLDEGSDSAEKSSWLTASVILVSLAFLCGALAAGLPSAGRLLLRAGYTFVGAGLVGAVGVELLL